jgi:hypothetical protein
VSYVVITPKSNVVITPVQGELTVLYPDYLEEQLLQGVPEVSLSSGAGTASGIFVVTGAGVGVGLLSSNGSAAGIGSANAAGTVSGSAAIAVGSSSATSTVNGIATGVGLLEGVGNAVGFGNAAAVGSFSGTTNSVATAFGSGTAAGISRGSSQGLAAGVGRANGVSPVIAGWQNTAISNETSTFEFNCDALPNTASLNGVIGLSNGTASAYTTLACIVRFNNSAPGTIDVRNGAAYAADVVLNYAAGTTYHVRIVGNVTTHTYDVYITPAGGVETKIATNYAFRSEQASVTQLNNFANAPADVGSVGVSNINMVSVGAPPVVISTTFNLTLPLSVGQTVGTVQSSNNPTSWSFVTLATVSAVGSARGTSSATGVVATSSGTWVDGLAGAPTGAPQFPNVLNNYPAGHGRRDKNVINQPPFNVPGVDYRVGLQTGVTLAVAGPGNVPAGCTWTTHTTSGSGGPGIVVPSGSGNVVIQNLDMGDSVIEIHTTGLATVLIQNCRWNIASERVPIFFFASNAIATIQYCEMYANNFCTQDGFIGWEQGGGSASATTTIQWCYFEKVEGDGFDWRNNGGNFCIQYCVVYDGLGSGHPDITQIENGGTQKIWNNFGYYPNNGTQGWMSDGGSYPSITSQNVLITPSGNAYSANTSDTSYTSTNRFVFHNNYVDNGTGGFALIYPYNTALVDVAGNIHMPSGGTFS